MKNELEMKDKKVLDVRMYFFTVSSLKGISQGIMCGHAALRYARLFSADNPEVWDFVDNHETWIILNGGTTNDERDFESIPVGSLNQIGDQLQENDIKFSYFVEPDLNNALTAICFICDERIFNRKDYPDFVNWLMDIKMYDHAKDEANKNNPELWVKLRLYPELQQEMFPVYYKEWVRFIGGIKNAFLRDLLSDKKLA